MYRTLISASLVGLLSLILGLSLGFSIGAQSSHSADVHTIKMGDGPREAIYVLDRSGRLLDIITVGNAHKKLLDGQ